jgi:hypothetical protein
MAEETGRLIHQAVVQGDSEGPESGKRGQISGTGSRLGEATIPSIQLTRGGIPGGYCRDSPRGDRYRRDPRSSVDGSTGAG